MKNQNPKQEQVEKALQIFKSHWFYFGLAGSVVLLILLFLILPKYNAFVTKQVSLQTLIGEIEGDNENGQFFGLKGNLKKIEAEYTETKKTIDQQNAEKQEILKLIFPEDEGVSFLTQLLERYAIDHDSEKNPFEMNSISFSKASSKNKTVVTPVDYATLQVNLPLKLGEKNFEDFIEFIQASGSLNEADFYNETFPVPLMTIDSLNFSYTEDETIGTLVNANFILNIYTRSTQNNVNSTK